MQNQWHVADSEPNDGIDEDVEEDYLKSLQLVVKTYEPDGVVQQDGKEECVECQHDWYCRTKNAVCFFRIHYYSL